jgi:hypothetical protein
VAAAPKVLRVFLIENLADKLFHKNKKEFKTRTRQSNSFDSSYLWAKNFSCDDFGRRAHVQRKQIVEVMVDKIG